MITISNFDDFNQYLGKYLGRSNDYSITQQQINQFADVTLDHQWIHIDIEKASQSPFKSTIAHGYLTLSILPYLWAQIIEVKNLKMMVNYGIESLKFGQAVLPGDKIFLEAKLDELSNLRGITKAKVSTTLNIVGSNKVAYKCTIILLYHFND